jgi:hypothetical protein
MKTLSRQRIHQLSRIKQGLCRICLVPRNLYAELCDACEREYAAARRRREGSAGPWRPGGMGRPPLWSKHAVDMSTEKK